MRLTESQLRRAIRRALLTEQAAPPFKNMTKQQGDKFRNWVNDKHFAYAKEIDLDRSGSPNNEYVKEAWGKYGSEYLKDLGQSARAATPGIDVQSGSGPAKKSTNSQPNKTVGRSDLQKAIKSGKSLKRGSQGNAVRYIQTMLSTGVDGGFGSKTEKAVRAFQKSQKLQSHGAVDRETARKLFLLKEPVSVKAQSEKDATNDNKEGSVDTSILASGIKKSGVLGANLISKMFFSFVLRRSGVWTEAELGEDIIDSLKDIVKWSRSNLGLGKKSKVSFGDDAHYASVAKKYGRKYRGDMRSQMAGGIADSFVNKDPLHNIRNTITHCYISKIGKNSYIVEDQYDFNPVVNILGKKDASGGARTDPEFFKSWMNFGKFIGNAMTGNLMIKDGGGWKPVSFLSKSGIENLSRFYEGLFNYKGFPIKIKINL